MGHTAFKDLDDVTELLERIRALADIREPKPAIFYIKSKAFLHFHDAEGKRWADAKEGDGWGESMPLPFGASKRQMNDFFKEVCRRHATVTEKRKPGRR